MTPGYPFPGNLLIRVGGVSNRFADWGCEKLGTVPCADRIGESVTASGAKWIVADFFTGPNCRRTAGLLWLSETGWAESNRSCLQ